MFKIKYTYDNPSGAGPFKGAAVVSTKHAKGDYWYGPFGSATVTSCGKVKEPAGRTFQQVCDDQLRRG